MQTETGRVDIHEPALAQKSSNGTRKVDLVIYEMITELCIVDIKLCRKQLFKHADHHEYVAICANWKPKYPNCCFYKRYPKRCSRCQFIYVWLQDVEIRWLAADKKRTKHSRLQIYIMYTGGVILIHWEMWTSKAKWQIGDHTEIIKVFFIAALAMYMSYSTALHSWLIGELLNSRHPSVKTHTCMLTHELWGYHPYTTNEVAC